MAWCEANRVDFLFGLARNERLEEAIRAELMTATLDSIRTWPVRRAASRIFTWSTLDSWSRSRRVVGKAEVTRGDANPRFVVTSLKPAEVGARYLYETGLLRPRRRWRTASRNASSTCSLIRTSTATMRANQLRLWLASMAYALLCGPAPHRPGIHAICRSDLRHHPAQAAGETRRTGAHQCSTHQGRDGSLGMPVSERVWSRLHPPQKCRRSLTEPDSAQAAPTPYATLPAWSRWCTARPKFAHRQYNHAYAVYTTATPQRSYTRRYPV